MAESFSAEIVPYTGTEDESEDLLRSIFDSIKLEEAREYDVSRMMGSFNWVRNVFGAPGLHQISDFLDEGIMRGDQGFSIFLPSSGEGFEITARNEDANTIRFEDEADIEKAITVFKRIEVDRCYSVESPTGSDTDKMGFFSLDDDEQDVCDEPFEVIEVTDKSSEPVSKGKEKLVTVDQHSAGSSGVKNKKSPPKLRLVLSSEVKKPVGKLVLASEKNLKPKGKLVLSRDVKRNVKDVKTEMTDVETKGNKSGSIIVPAKPAQKKEEPKHSPVKSIKMPAGKVNLLSLANRKVFIPTSSDLSIEVRAPPTFIIETEKADEVEIKKPDKMKEMTTTNKSLIDFKNLLKDKTFLRKATKAPTEFTLRSDREQSAFGRGRGSYPGYRTNREVSEDLGDVKKTPIVKVKKSVQLEPDLDTPNKVSKATLKEYIGELNSNNYGHLAFDGNPIVPKLSFYGDFKREITDGRGMSTEQKFERMYHTICWMDKGYSLVNMKYDAGDIHTIVKTRGVSVNTTISKHSTIRLFKVSESSMSLSIKLANFEEAVPSPPVSSEQSDKLNEKETVKGVQAFRTQKPCNQFAGKYIDIVAKCWLEFGDGQPFSKSEEVKNEVFDYGRLRIVIENDPANFLIRIRVFFDDVFCSVYVFDAVDNDIVRYLTTVFSFMLKNPNTLIRSGRGLSGELSGYEHAAGIDEIITRVASGESLVLKSQKKPNSVLICGILQSNEKTPLDLLNAACFGRQMILSNRPGAHFVRPGHVKTSTWRTFLSLYMKFYEQGIQLPQRKGTLKRKNNKMYSERLWAKCISWELITSITTSITIVKTEMRKTFVKEMSYSGMVIDKKLSERCIGQTTMMDDVIKGGIKEVRLACESAIIFSENYPIGDYDMIENSESAVFIEEFFDNAFPCAVDRKTAESVRNLSLIDEKLKFVGISRNMINDGRWTHKDLKPMQTQRGKDGYLEKMNVTICAMNREKDTGKRVRVHRENRNIHWPHMEPLAALNGIGFDLSLISPKCKEYFDFHNPKYEGKYGLNKYKGLVYDKEKDVFVKETKPVVVEFSPDELKRMTQTYYKNCRLSKGKNFKAPPPDFTKPLPSYALSPEDRETRLSEMKGKVGETNYRKKK